MGGGRQHVHGSGNTGAPSQPCHDDKLLECDLLKSERHHRFQEICSGFRKFRVQSFAGFSIRCTKRRQTKHPQLLRKRVWEPTVLNSLNKIGSRPAAEMEAQVRLLELARSECVGGGVESLLATSGDCRQPTESWSYSYLLFRYSVVPEVGAVLARDPQFSKVPRKVVYDVTRLLTNHEGGRRVIEQMCGRDGSIGFWCIHTMEDLQESINDGDAMEICRSAASTPPARRLDEDEDDDEGMRNNCAAGGSLPVPPSTAIQASDVTLHKSSDDCWTSMDDGTRKVVMDLSLYTHFHPGGKAYVLSMCGQDSTASYRAFHPFAYVGQGVNHGYIVLKGLLQGEYPAPPTTTTAAGGTSGGGSTQYTGITAAVLATHATAGDCWGRIGSWVVDMTALRSTHPAGSSMLLCGQDVTASFRSIHADSYISRMPVMGTYDAGGGRNPSPSPATTTTGAPTPAPAPAINTGGTSILNPTVPTESVTVISSSAMAWHAVLSDCWLAMKCKVLLGCFMMVLPVA